MYPAQQKWVPGPLDCQVLCNEPCTNQQLLCFVLLTLKVVFFSPPYFLGDCARFSRLLISLASYFSSCDLKEVEKRVCPEDLSALVMIHSPGLLESTSILVEDKLRSRGMIAVISFPV